MAKQKNDEPTAIEEFTDKGAGKIGSALKRTQAAYRKVPGPSTNPATNLLVADIAMRGASILFRRTVEKGLLRARFDPDKARAIVEGRTLGRTLISAGVARMATRSIPGFLLVSGGIAAKSILDRSVARRQSRRKGDRQLEEQAEE